MSTTSDLNKPYRLLAPGPVPVPPAVLQAMSGKVLHHRTPEFLDILNFVWGALKDVFQTRALVQILTGTGSSAMEAAVVNTLSSNDDVIVVVSGKFGERWAEMCDRFGMNLKRFDVGWGGALDLEKFRAFLKANPRAKAVLTQACETSTATLHPIQKMAAITREVLPDALFEVDAITAIGCTPLPMDEWGLDVVVAGSQKAFMIPTGLSFIALSERAWAAQAASTTKKFYLDLRPEKKANLKGDSQFSIPTPLVVGLGVVLKQLQSAGRERLFKRCAGLAEATRFAGAGIGLMTYSHAPSPSVTALTTPEDSAKLRDWLEREQGITVMGGQDSLKGKILRVGHMGDVRDEDMLALFSALALKVGRAADFEAKVMGELTAKLKATEPLF